MNVVDQRILIPRSPRLVWDYVSDLSNNPGWQADCSAVSFLSSKHIGPGVRWRYATNTGREQVAEITVWYDGLGYEYIWVDGAPFKDGKGRLRLQEIAEGTIVQWTITYQSSGLLGGVRNALSVKRQVENTMTDSLRALWKVIQQLGPDEQSHEAKSLMRDAPNYESRVQYRPRHPSHKEKSVAHPQPVIEEPPLSDEDTRPRSPVVAPIAVVEVEPVPLSQDPGTGLEQLTAEPPVLTPPSPESKTLMAPAEKSASSIAKGVVQVTEVIAPRGEMRTGAVPSVEPVQAEQVASVGEQPVEVVGAKSGLSQLESIRTELPPVARPPTVEPVAVPVKPTEATGSVVVSVFDVFGLPRPSLATEIPHETNVVAETVDEQVKTGLSPLGGRVGFRLLTRRRRVRLRRA